MLTNKNTEMPAGARRKPHGERGFTLIEVLIALTILTIGLLAVATMQISAIHGNKMGNDISRAIFLAQDKLEELKSSEDITDTISVPANGSDETGIFNRSWGLGPSGTNSRSVTVTVSWTTRGNNHSVTLNTISRGGGY